MRFPSHVSVTQTALTAMNAQVEVTVTVIPMSIIYVCKYAPALVDVLKVDITWYCDHSDHFDQVTSVLLNALPPRGASCEYSPLTRREIGDARVMNAEHQRADDFVWVMVGRARASVAMVGWLRAITGLGPLASASQKDKCT